MLRALAIVGLALATAAEPVTFDPARAQTHIEVLAAEPRPTGSEAYAAAASYVYGEFQALGLQPSLLAMTEPDKAGELVPTVNVAAELPGWPLVILGAHLDSVEAAPGANDNASGVAAMLEVARVLSAAPQPTGVRFVAFDAEEIGHYGSKAYVRNLPEADRDAVLGMLNLDMVGAGGPLVLTGDERLQTLARQEAAALGIAARANPPDPSSDHRSFLQFGVPALHIGRQDARQHTSRDVPDIISPEMLSESATLVLRMVEVLQHQTVVPTRYAPKTVPVLPPITSSVLPDSW